MLRCLMVKFNINNNIRFKLTDHGNEVLQAHINSVDFGIRDPESHRGIMRDNNAADKDGCHTMHMWYAMSVFGDYLYNGAENVFEGNLIYIDNDQQASNDMIMCDKFVIKIGNGLVRSGDDWKWSGHHATTNNCQNAAMFNSIDSAKAYYKNECGVIKDTGKVSYMKLALIEVAEVVLL